MGGVQVIMAHTPDPSGKPKMLHILGSTGAEEMGRWRAQLEEFDGDVEDYKLRHPYYKPKLSEWVERRTWIQLSERKLKPGDRTDGTRPNDKAVEDLLRLRGKYALDSTDAGKVSYAAPHEEFERIVWPDPLTSGTSYLRAFEVYLDLWRTLKLTMPKSELPTQKLLCNIMEGAIKPPGLKARVISRRKSGKNPFGQPGAEMWRRTAHKDVNNLIDLIHENADQMDQYKKRPLSERQHVDELPIRAVMMDAQLKPNEELMGRATTLCVRCTAS